MKDNMLTVFWGLFVLVSLFTFVNFYMVCDLRHDFDQHVEPQEDYVERSCIEDMLSPINATITIKIDRNDTSTISKSK